MERGEGRGPGRPWVWLLGRGVPEAWRDAALGDALEEFRLRAIDLEAEGTTMTMWMKDAGLLLGLIGVWATTSVLERLVYGVGATDPLTLALGCVALGAVALAASTLPALRAVRVSPVLVLRSE